VAARVACPRPRGGGGGGRGPGLPSAPRRLQAELGLTRLHGAHMCGRLYTKGRGAVQDAEQLVSKWRVAYNSGKRARRDPRGSGAPAKAGRADGGPQLGPPAAAGGPPAAAGAAPAPMAAAAPCAPSPERRHSARGLHLSQPRALQRHLEQPLRACGDRLR
jgi:hypothetical protein